MEGGVEMWREEWKCGGRSGNVEGGVEMFLHTSSNLNLFHLLWCFVRETVHPIV